MGLFDSRFGSFEQPVKQIPSQYKIQPGKIENYTPGKSSVSDKEAKQVTSDDRFSVESVVYYSPISQLSTNMSNF
jgi:hypothetical protein